MIVWLPLVVSVVALGLGIIPLVILMLFDWDSNHVLYWTMFQIERGWIGEACCIFMGSYVAFLCTFRLSQSLQMERIAKAGIFAGVVASILYGGIHMELVLGGGFFNRREHLETVMTSDHVYHLQFYAGDVMERNSHYYHLYECDRLDILCSKVFSLHTGISNLTTIVNSARLIREGETVSVEINGDEIVYTHSS
jgi:hypothetical protein